MSEENTNLGSSRARGIPCLGYCVDTETGHITEKGDCILYFEETGDINPVKTGPDGIAITTYHMWLARVKGIGLERAYATATKIL